MAHESGGVVLERPDNDYCKKCGQQWPCDQAPLQHVSLFSGVGGFDLAAERAGMQPAAMCEIDTNAQNILKKHWPNTPLFTDVKEVTGDSLRQLGIDPARTVLTGGFPCQDVSVAGRRTGLAGARTGLFWEIIRILNEFQPTWIVLENVPGLLTTNSGRDMGTVLGSLALSGYNDLAYRILDSKNFGVPQRRRRIFIVGRLGPTGERSGKILAITESSRRHPQTSEQAGSNIAATLTSSAHRAGVNTPGRRTEDDVNLVVNTLTANGLGGGWSGRQPRTSRTPVDIAATLNSGGNTGGFRTEPGEHLVVCESETRSNQHGR